MAAVGASFWDTLDLLAGGYLPGGVSPGTGFEPTPVQRGVDYVVQPILEDTLDIVGTPIAIVGQPLAEFLTGHDYKTGDFYAGIHNLVYQKQPNWTGAVEATADDLRDVPGNLANKLLDFTKKVADELNLGAFLIPAALIAVAYLADKHGSKSE